MDTQLVAGFWYRIDLISSFVYLPQFCESLLWAFDCCLSKSGNFDNHRQDRIIVEIVEFRLLKFMVIKWKIDLDFTQEYVMVFVTHEVILLITALQANVVR